MGEATLRTIAQLQEFLDATEEIIFSARARAPGCPKLRAPQSRAQAL